jgi:hypothetical protein
MVKLLALRLPPLPPPARRLILEFAPELGDSKGDFAEQFRSIRGRLYLRAVFVA